MGNRDVIETVRKMNIGIVLDLAGVNSVRLEKSEIPMIKTKSLEILPTVKMLVNHEPSGLQWEENMAVVSPQQVKTSLVHLE